MTRPIVLVIVVLAAGLACSAASRSKLAPVGDAGSNAAAGSATDAAPSGDFGALDAQAAAKPTCPDLPPPPSGLTLDLASEYQGVYSVYELGSVPGIGDVPLGGAVLAAGTTDTLLIGVESESANGALYSIKVKRDACDHIVSWDGVATRVADAPYVDATLLYAPGDVLMIPMWSAMTLNKIGQLPPGAAAPLELELTSSGVGKGGPGGLGFVPPSVPAAAGQLRILTQSAETHDGTWYHVEYRSGGPNGTYVFLNGVEKSTLENWPGGFAYVPQGSPGFDEQALIVAEWDTNTVATYVVDDQGDPIVSTRKPFFHTFPRPWGAYFEPVAGDYLFLTWRAQQGGVPVADRVVVVAGFKPPPPPPSVPPPK